MGDFNARTSNNKNVPLPDSYAIDRLISQRISQDYECKSCTYSEQLLELCTSSELHILNGRSFGDPNGNFTCHRYNGSSL